MEKRFNLRVYGILIHNGKVLVNEEQIKGRTVIKFPGGGLHWGEGTIDGLKREWKEELGMNINITQHFYTTDFFQQSAFDDSQVISIYYLVQPVSTLNEQIPIINLMQNERAYWMDLKDVSTDTFTLQIDKVVGGMLCEQYSSA